MTAVPDPERVGAWTDRAACRGQTALMFSPDEFSQRLAVTLCRRCPVVAECRADVTAFEARGAEAGGAVYGVVGGLLPEQRGTWR
jgi:hypothetical protein